MKKIVCILFMVILLAGCKQSTESSGDNGSEMATLIVSFIDPIWDGIMVPLEGQCVGCGGGGMSPGIHVAGIPAGATIVRVEFNDLDAPHFASGGGHGSIYVMVDGRTAVTIPSIPEMTLDLPDGVFMEHGHAAESWEPGAYLGPCSCGRGNRYQANVEAIARGTGADSVLARSTIDLGRF